MLLLLGEVVLDAFPYVLTLGTSATSVTLSVDGQTHAVPLARPVTSARLAEPPELRREYQVDGSDSTNNFTLNLDYFATQRTTPYYRFQAWLRDESSYSRWRNLVVRDPSGKQLLAASDPEDGRMVPFPPGSTLSAEVHRLESPVAIELVDRDNGVVRIELNRNDKLLRVQQTTPGSQASELGKWFFPNDPLPFAAELAYFALRTLSVAMLLVLLALVVASILPTGPDWRPRRWQAAGALGLAAALAAAGSLYAAVALFDRAPHILDAVSYTFQAKVFAEGALSAPAPAVRDAFPTPFMVVHDGRWFSQYPPGTPLSWAAGMRVGAAWLVGPVLAVAAVLLVFLIGQRQLGTGSGLLAAGLMASSPFLFLQAGSFLSHVPAMAYASLFLYAAIRWSERPSVRAALVAAVALGLTFWTREIVAVLYGVPVGAFCLSRGWQTDARRASQSAAAGVAVLLLFAGGYLAYDAALTGSPFVLPRALFNGSDRFGFGDGIGFYGRHTLASGLANADELLTSLTITLFGWPFSTALAVVALPFVLRRAGPWDCVHASVVGLFVVAYVGYFYHGIALGPRYYFEALPSLCLLAARGFGTLADWLASHLGAWQRGAALQRSRSAVAAILVALLASNAVYFLPRQAELYRGFSGLPGGGGPRLGSFVERSVAGRASTLDSALVTTGDWWVYATYLAELNCPSLSCAAVYAFAPDAAAAQAVRARYPERRWYTVQNRAGTLEAVPAGQ